MSTLTPLQSASLDLIKAGINDWEPRLATLLDSLIHEIVSARSVEKKTETLFDVMRGDAVDYINQSIGEARAHEPQAQPTEEKSEAPLDLPEPKKDSVSTAPTTPKVNHIDPPITVVPSAPPVEVKPAEFRPADRNPFVKADGLWQFKQQYPEVPILSVGSFDFPLPILATIVTMRKQAVETKDIAKDLSLLMDAAAHVAPRFSWLLKQAKDENLSYKDIQSILEQRLAEGKLTLALETA